MSENRLEEIRQRWVGRWVGDPPRPFIWRDGDVAWLVGELERLRDTNERLGAECKTRREAQIGLGERYDALKADRDALERQCEQLREATETLKAVGAEYGEYRTGCGVEFRRLDDLVAALETEVKRLGAFIL